MSDYQVNIAQWLAWRLATRDVPVSNPGKGDVFDHFRPCERMRKHAFAWSKYTTSTPWTHQTLENMTHCVCVGGGQHSLPHRECVDKKVF